MFFLGLDTLIQYSKVNFLVFFITIPYGARIFELVRSPRIDSKEPTPLDGVAWQADTTTLFLLGSLPP